MFEAFRSAVINLLDALRPDGEIVAPPPLVKTKQPSWQVQYDDPEHCGRDVARSLLDSLQFYGATAPEEVAAAIRLSATEAEVTLDEEFLDVSTQMHYGRADAARDLGVECYWDPESVMDTVEDRPTLAKRDGVRSKRPK